MLAVLFNREPVLHSPGTRTQVPQLGSCRSAQLARHTPGAYEAGMAKDRQIAGGCGAPRKEGRPPDIQSRYRTKLSISDVTDRAFMLEDVAGRVGLLRRDLADVMRQIRR